MFGYVVANGKLLSPEQLERYRGCYCGLCRSLKERHGELSRLTLNYDMTFLVILLSAMYEPGESGGCERCLPHPVHSRKYWTTEFTDYAADMNIALAYHNSLDDWRDEKKPASLAMAKLLEKHYAGVRERWPEQCAKIEECLAGLLELERAKRHEPDAAADRFGELMSALFVCRPDPVWAESLGRFGTALGRFIYMMDACVDVEKDMKRGRFNPLAEMHGAGLGTDEKTAILKMLIGECTREFELLPIVQDVDILRNVLYSGVWTQYSLALKKGKDKGEDDKRSL